MNARQALDEGYTHHGSYYGLPVWIGRPEREGMLVAAKWAAADPLLSAILWIEGVIRSIAFPDTANVFQFKVGKRIVLS